MATGIDPNRIDRYMLEADRKLPKEKQTVFLLKPLKCSQKTRLMDEATDTTGKPINPTGFVVAVASLGLVGWENFKTEEGAEIPFSLDGNKASDESLSAIAFEDLSELMRRILELSGLSEIQKKK